MLPQQIFFVFPNFHSFLKTILEKCIINKSVKQTVIRYMYVYIYTIYKENETINQ